MNRRHFITASAAATLLWPRAAFATSGPGPWRMRLSTSSIHFKQLPIEEACAQIAALGFDAIDIWSAYDGCPHLDDVAKRLGPDGLASLLAKHQLRLAAFSTYIGGYARYAQLLGKAGGAIAIQGSAPPCAPNELTRKMRSFLESLKPLVALAEEHHSFLAIENHGASLLDSLDSFKAFVDLNTSRRLGIALAPYHLQAAHQSVPEAIEACGRQLLFFYAWQFQPDMNQLPAHGPTDFKPCIDALRKISFSGWVNPFMHGHVAPDKMAAGLAKARAYLLSLTT